MRRGILLLVVAGAAALIFVSLRPSPVRVETARAQRGPLRVTVDEEGETRAHDRFVVASPVAGRLARIGLEDGDAVRRDQVIASIDPLPLTTREREEVTARVEAAQSVERQAQARVEHARADHQQAQRDLARTERLAKDGVVSSQVLEQARNAETTAADELAAARFSAQAAASEVKIAKAGLIALESERGNGSRIVRLRAPVSGNVLRVLEKSERVVAPGMALMVLGDPAKIEVVVDVLSTDAVKIEPGAPVELVGWGGDHPLRARVRLVEPEGFTKISALGIEEKRVNVIADFVDPPGRLGDGYRVETRIIIWSGANVLQAPSSALFRQGSAWCVFLIEGGKARRREVEAGHRGETATEILRGLDEGATVIVHPTNQIADGARVTTR
jgi:HlyD family secretion protein